MSGTDVGPLDDYGVPDEVKVTVAPYGGRTRFVCPFCDEMIIEATTLDRPDVIEAVLRAHIVERHPIRWRLHRKMRRHIRNSNERKTG